MLSNLISQSGVRLEYAVDTIVELGDPLRGRAPRTEREWVPFKALWGEPSIDALNVDFATLETAGVQIHTLVKLDLDTPIRRGTTEYKIRAQSDYDVNGEIFNRYVLIKTVVTKTGA